MTEVKKKTPKKVATKKTSKKEVIIPENDTPDFKSFVSENNKFKPSVEIYNGYEIEKRWVLLSVEEDYTKQKNGVALYNKVMEKGIRYEQGYIHDQSIAIEMLEHMGIELAEHFKPNTVRLRKFQNSFILTLKNRKETKKREVEWEIDKKLFLQYWKHTKGARVYKTRLIEKVKGWNIEFDAFTDRYLLMAECEVQNEADLDKLPKLGMDVTGNKAWTNKTLAK